MYRSRTLTYRSEFMFSRWMWSSERPFVQIALQISSWPPPCVTGNTKWSGILQPRFIQILSRPSRRLRQTEASSLQTTRVDSTRLVTRIDGSHWERQWQWRMAHWTRARLWRLVNKYGYNSMFPVPSICIRSKIFAISATVLNVEWRNFDFDFLRQRYR